MISVFKFAKFVLKSLKKNFRKKNFYRTQTNLMKQILKIQVRENFQNIMVSFRVLNFPIRSKIYHFSVPLVI